MSIFGVVTNGIKAINLGKKVAKAAFMAKKYGPAIGVISGSIGTVVAGVWAVKKSIDEAPEVLGSCQQDIQIAKKTGGKGELVKAYGRSFAKLGKVYAGPAIVEIVSVGGILYGFNVLSGRFVAMSATAATLETALNESNQRLYDYQAGLKEKYGEGFDSDVKWETSGTISNENQSTALDDIEVETTDENGNVVKETVKKVINGPGFPSPYAVIFDETSTEWSKDPEYNKMTLRRIQQTCNDMLHAKGHLFLNEVYRELGLPDTRAGQMVGWIDGMGDSYVDFGLYDIECVPNRAEFINGFEPSIILDFNVDGIIWDKI